MIISSNLTVANQCLEAMNRTINLLGIINHNVYKSREIIGKL